MSLKSFFRTGLMTAFACVFLLGQNATTQASQFPQLPQLPQLTDSLGISCYGEVNAGLGTTTADVTDGANRVSIGLDGFVAGVGLGCDYQISWWGFGVLARYDFTSQSTRLAGESASYDNQWIIAPRLIVQINDSLDGYFFAGVAGTNFEVRGIGDVEAVGYVLGGGVEFEVDAFPFDIGLEANYLDYGSEILDGDRIDNTGLGFRARAIYRFF